MVSFSDSVRTKLRRVPAVLSNPAPIGQIKNDLASRIDAASQLSPSNDPIGTVDVQPDTRFPFLAIYYWIMSNFSAHNFKDHSLISPPSVMAYSLFIIYGFMFISDITHRQATSPAAAYLLGFPHYQNLIDLLVKCCVPEPVIPILEHLMPSSTAFRKRLDFVPTLAAFHIDYDFFRTIPPHAFLASHNCLAREPTNARPLDVLLNWLRTTLITIGTTSYDVNDLLGYSDYTAAGTNINEELRVYPNWFNTKAIALSMDVTARFNLARPILEEINIFPITVATQSQVNGYQYIFGNSSSSVTYLLNFLEQMSAYFSVVKNSNNMLIHIIDNMSAKDLFKHVIMPPALPTGTITTTIPATATRGLIPVRRNTTAFAELAKFLQPHTVNPTTAILQPAANLITTMFYLSRDTAYDATRDPIKYLQFNEDQDVTPESLYFDPFEKNASAHFTTIISGVLIENGEIDGIAIPTADPRSTPAANNSQFHQGAIQLHHLRRPLRHDYLDVVKRDRQFANKQGITILLYNYAVSTVPRFTNIVSGYITALIGPTELTHVGETSRGFNVFGRKTCENSTFVTNDLYFWSSYRLVECETHSDSYAAPIQDIAKISMFPTLRHLFGLDPSNMLGVHPALMIK